MRRRHGIRLNSLSLSDPLGDQAVSGLILACFIARTARALSVSGEPWAVAAQKKGRGHNLHASPMPNHQGTALTVVNRRYAAHPHLNPRPEGEEQEARGSDLKHFSCLIVLESKWMRC